MFTPDAVGSFFFRFWMTLQIYKNLMYVYVCGGDGGGGGGGT